LINVAMNFWIPEKMEKYSYLQGDPH
jgi:hypothetical protein